MKTLMKSAAVAATLTALSACSTAGGLGSVLGSVLGTGNSGQQIQASVRSVDTRNQQIALTQSNGSTVNVLYDANTKVVYNNRLYAVTNLESGDQVTARIQTTQNNAYYTDSIFVTQSVTTSTSGGTVSNESVQSFSGSVLSIDRNYGTFDIDAGNGVRLTISMPYSTATSDASTYNNMRVGNFVRFYGVYLSNSRVQLRNFY